MIFVLALAVGTVIGSAPTADWVARRDGIELRASGTRNPGANNAFQTGGKRLGAMVLLVELVKGFGAVWIGDWLAGGGGAALGGVGATVGNVYNPWFRFRGGKGLAITGGALLAAWPLAAGVLAAVIATGIALWRRSGPASLLAFGFYLAAAVAGLFVDLPGRWAISNGGWAAVMAAGHVLTMFPKHLTDLVRPGGRLESRG